MQTRTLAVMAMVAAFAASGTIAPAATDTESAAVRRIVQTWSMIRRFDVDSAEFAGARGQLAKMISALAQKDRIVAATAMMDPDADDHVNTAALRFFGPDPLSLKDIRGILWNTRRTRSERVLLRTFYSFFRGEYRESPLSEPVRRQLVGFVLGRVERLTGRSPGYGEERLLTHLTASILSRYAYKADKQDDIRKLMTCLGRHAQLGATSDGLAAAIRGWETLIEAGKGVPLDDAHALAQLGHWSPLKRLEAVQYLAGRIGTDRALLRRVWALLRDPRDEPRAAAVQVFAVAPNAGPADVGMRLLPLLTVDRGTMVQEAAADALIVRIDQLNGATERLLEVFRKRKPGRKRTGHILMVLSHLSSGEVGETQRKHMLALAIAKLDLAPQGALALFKSLGPKASPALRAIIAYHSNAPRRDRDYIDRHVMPAITGRRLRPHRDKSGGSGSETPGAINHLVAVGR